MKDGLDSFRLDSETGDGWLFADFSKFDVCGLAKIEVSAKHGKAIIFLTREEAIALAQALVRGTRLPPTIEHLSEPAVRKTIAWKESKL